MSGSSLTHNFVIAPPSRPAASSAAVVTRRGRGQNTPSAWTHARELWRRYRTRVAIARLDAHLLRDIGVTFSEAEQEANKPFWRR